MSAKGRRERLSVQMSRSAKREGIPVSRVGRPEGLIAHCAGVRSAKVLL